MMNIRYMTPGGISGVAENVYIGVFATGVSPGSPAAGSSLPSKNFFITKIGSENVDTFNKFSQIMNTLSPGQTVDIEYEKYEDGVMTSGTAAGVTLGNNGGKAYLGVFYTLSGFSFTTPGQVLEAAKNPLYGKESASDMALAAIGYIGAPMRGYSPIPQELSWWYHSSMMPDEMFWPLLQTVFWIFWLNLVLGVTNALPAVPFDGGYLFMDGVGYIVDKARKNDPPEKREKIAATVASIMSYAMLFLLMLVMVAALF
jgi:membrane-associated protease RseP (regulator of RpoE activity)